MGEYLLKHVLAWGLLLAIAGSTGCTTMEKSFAYIKGETTTDVVPGVSSPAERMAALEAIRQRAGSAGPDESQQTSAQLAAAYQDETDPAIRAAIVRAGAGYPTEAARNMLETALADPDADVRIAACRALGQKADADAVRMLGGALQSDVDTDVRLAAVAALGSTGHSSAVPLLGQALEERDPAMQYEAVQALRSVTGEDLGNNVNHWRQFVQGERPPSAEPVSIVERFRRIF